MAKALTQKELADLRERARRVERAAGQRRAGPEASHPRAGHEFDITDHHSVASFLDDPQLARLNGVDPVNQLIGWRLTGDLEAQRRGGLIFAGESRSGQDVTRHYRKRTWWRVIWFALCRPYQERMRG